MIPSPQYATFWQRLTAFMLDIFIIAIPVFTLVIPLATSVFFDLSSIKSAQNQQFEFVYQFYKHGVYISLIGFAAISLVLAVFATSRWQATPGKRIVNIYIARKNGSKISFADAFGRFLSLPLFILMIQIFERRENYAALTAIKHSGNISTDLLDLEKYLNGPIAQATSYVVFVVIIVWFSKVFFSPENAAMHDSLFNTRVFQGKK